MIALPLLALLLAACGDRGPAVQQLQLDEIGPSDAEEAFAAAELVVLGEVTAESGGARFFGGDDAEDPDPGPWFEDATFTVKVEEVFKGTVAGDTIAVQWPSYVAEEPSSEARIAHLEVQGVRMAEGVGDRFLFFLSDQGAFGLTGVSLGAGVAEVRGEVVEGQVAPSLSGLRGTTLNEFRRQATQGQSAGD